MESESTTKKYWNFFKSKKLTKSDGISMRGRLISGILTFSCIAIIYMQRNNFYVVLSQVVTISKPDPNKFSWTQNQKALSLMAFDSGYWTTQIIGGCLADKFGCKGPMGFAVFFSSILCILTPMSMAKSPYFLAVVRVLLGIVQGLFPATFLVIVTRWFPQSCRCTALGLIFPGLYLGSIFSFVVPSALAQNQALWGVSFYIFGGIGILWTICWIIFYTDDPKKNKFTKIDEKMFICDNMDRKPMTNLKQFPFRKAFTSKPVYAVIVNLIAGAWSSGIVVSVIPSLIEDIYYLEVKDQLYLTFLVPCLTWLGVIFSSSFFDYILSKRDLQKITLRNIFNFFCLVPTGILFLLSTLIPPEKYYFGILLLLIACFCSGFEVVVSMPNIGDIAPQYTGIIFGTANSIATIISIATDKLTYSIVTDTHKPWEWQIIFGIMIGIQITGLIVFYFFSSGTIQTWAIQKDKSEELYMRYLYMS